MNRAERKRKNALIRKATGKDLDTLLEHAITQLQAAEKDNQRLKVLLTEAGDLLGSDMTYILSMDKVGIPAPVAPFFMQAEVLAARTQEFTRISAD